MNFAQAVSPDRRLDGWRRRDPGFDDYLAAKQEQVLMLPEGHFTHFDNIVKVEGIR